jgi:hypothetical protein
MLMGLNTQLINFVNSRVYDCVQFLTPWQYIFCSPCLYGSGTLMTKPASQAVYKDSFDPPIFLSPPAI